MKTRKSLTSLLIATLFCGLVLINGSCRSGKRDNNKNASLAVISPELQRNALGGLPGALYHSQADSPIHWQPWTKASMEHAKSSRRLVFCVVAMPQQTGFLKVLNALVSSPDTVAAINEFYVPILVDGDAAREMGVLSAELCAEIRRPLQLPLFIWMTHEGNPVAWIPVSSSEPEAVFSFFNQSHSMISQIWEDDAKTPVDKASSGYVLKNSALDNGNRRRRFEQRKVSMIASEQPAVDVVSGIRQLASLYDPYSRSFDEAGGLFPSSSLELLATAATRPGLPSELHTRCMETTRGLLSDLLASAMFDPLDGSVFSSRRGNSWSFPSYERDCSGHARAVVALIAACRATADERALEKALELVSFAEKNYLTPEGLFSIGLAKELDPQKFMWQVEDIEAALGAEDAAWWVKATGMKNLGNLPSEVDTQREYFRENTLGLSRSIAQIAADLSVSPEVFAPRFKAARAKLLAIRNERFGKEVRDEYPHAGASFRMVSAYAAVFTITGEDVYRTKAVDLLKRSREAFGSGAKLRVFAQKTPDSIGAGRAFLYALALQSALDVAAITSDDSWLAWSEDLATTAAEMFTGNGFLKECPDDAKIIDLPVTDFVMLFDDSTAGLVSMAESRLAEIGRPLVASFSELAAPLPTYVMDRPIPHTDLMLATLIRHYKIIVITGAGLPPALDAAIDRLPLRAIQRRSARLGEDVPAGSARVHLSEGQSIIVTTPEALQEALLPSPVK